jgi:hypothetical protein
MIKMGESNEDTHVSQDQMVAQVQDVDAPHPPPHVVDRRSTPLLQPHPQDLIIGSPLRGVMTRSLKFASFVEYHSFVSCIEPTSIDETLKDLDWMSVMLEESNNFTRNKVWTLEERQWLQESLEQEVRFLTLCSQAVLKASRPRCWF